MDGRRFRALLIAGSGAVRQTRDHLNNINVFPVADGDTGTNLALSLVATASAVKAITDRHLQRVAQCAAEASIVNAKGNSGVIMAHWFLGLSKACSNRPRVTNEGLSRALEETTREVYSGIDELVEGTMISIMKAVSDRAQRSAAADDLAQFMESVLEAAQIALARTPA